MAALANSGTLRAASVSLEARRRPDAATARTPGQDIPGRTADTNAWRVAGRASRLASLVVVLLLGVQAGETRAQAVDICERSSAVQSAIIAKIPGNPACVVVTAQQLTDITGTLALSNQSLAALQAGDFAGLAGLRTLRLDSNDLTTLPVGVFNGLAGLRTLRLDSNDLTTLPVGAFNGLAGLRTLGLNNNNLTTLPVGVFNGLAGLQTLSLINNKNLTILPVGVFNGLAGLQTLVLNHNENLTVLPAGVFNGLASLQYLTLTSNAFTPWTGLPPGIFDDVLDTLGPVVDFFSSGFSVDATVRAAHFVCSRDDAAAIVAATAGVDDCLRITVAQLVAAGVPPVATLGASGSPAEPTNGASNDAVTGAFTLHISPAPTSGTAAVTYTLSGTAQTADYAFASSSGVTIDSTTQLTIDFAQTPQAVLTLTPAHDTDSDLDETVILTVSGVDFSDATPDITSVAGSPRTLTIRDSEPAGICDRTPAVETAILARINAVEEPDVACDAVTGAHLGAITGTLDPAIQRLAALQAGDFAGLASLRTLRLDSNDLTTLPVGVFNGLAGLRTLRLNSNDLTILPVGVFNGLASLQTLTLYDNDLMTTLPVGVFNGLAGLQTLFLSNNESLTVLPVGVFNGLAGLQTLFLSNNESLTVLPVGVFNGLASLQILTLIRNAFTPWTGLPPGIFDDVLDTLGPIGAFADFRVDAVVRNAHFVCSRDDAAAIVAATAGVDDCLRITVAQLVAAGVPPVATLGASGSPAEPTDDASGDAVTGVFTLLIFPAPTSGTAAVTYTLSGTAQTADYAFASSAGVTIDSTTQLTIDFAQTPQAVLTLTPAHDTDSDLDETVILTVSGVDFSDATPDITSAAGSPQTLTIRDNDAADICDRTPAVEAAILARINAVEELDVTCDAVTGAHLGAITGTLDPAIQSAALQAGDFAGLASLRTLMLDNSDLTTLPVGLFNGLVNLRNLYLHDNALTPRTGLPPGIFDDVLDTLGPVVGPFSSGFRVDATVRAAHFVCARSDADDIVAATAGVDDCLRITVAQLAAAEVPTIAALGASGSPAEPTDDDAGDAVTGVFTLLISPEPTSGTAVVTYALSGTAQAADYALAPSAGVTIDSTTQLTIDLAQTPQAVLTLTPAHDTDSGLDETVILTVSGVDFSDATPDITSVAGSPQTLIIRDNDAADICDRTPAVEAAILAKINAVEEPDVTCDAVTGAHLGTITGTLDLSRQSLATLQAGDFAGLASLHALNLFFNALTTLPEELFNGLTRLQRLDLDSNDLATLPGGLFNDLARLQRLNLDFNELTTLPVGAFNGLARLQRLDLSDNELTTLPVGAFNGLASLQDLYLSDNELTTLPVGVFNGLASLQDLYLSDNELTSLPAGAFNGLASLQELDLTDNELTTLPEGLFNGLANLRRLNLSDNALTALPVGVFNGLANLQTLILINNAFTPRTGLPPGIFDDVLDTLGPVAGPFLYGFSVDATVRIAHFVCSRDDAAAIVAATAGVDDCLHITVAQLAAAGVLPIATLIASGSPAEPTDSASNDAVTGAFTLHISPAPTPGTAAVTYALSGTAQTADYALAPSAGVTIDSTTQLTIDLAQTPQAVLTLTPAHDTDSDLDETVILTVSGVDFSDATPDITSVAGSPQTLTTRDNDAADICDRTPAVETAILARINAVEESDVTCDAVTGAHLGAITGTLDLSRQSLAALQAGDFAGLASLRTLRLDNNGLTTLPVGVFNGLVSLQDLDLFNNELTTLPAGAFNGLASLRRLNLDENALTTLPAGMFNSLAGLQNLILTRNAFTSRTGLPPGIFDDVLDTLGTVGALAGFRVDAAVRNAHFVCARSDAAAIVAATAGVDDCLRITVAQLAAAEVPTIAALGASGSPAEPTDDDAGDAVTGVFTLFISPAPTSGTAVVTYALSGTAQAADYALAPPAGVTIDSTTQLTIDLAQTSQAIFTLTPAHDTDSDFGETVVLTVSGVDFSDATPDITSVAGSPQTLTIRDNEPPNICDRTPAVEAAILARINAVEEPDVACDAVTVAHLAAITGTLDFSSQSLTSLQAGDFAGLARLRRLTLSQNELTTLPEGVFNGLVRLRDLSLDFNELTTTLPEGLFNGLASLQTLRLRNNQLTTLPEGLFNGLARLRALSLFSNALTTLPEGVFNGLARLRNLSLDFNALTALPEGVFNGLASLQELSLSDNDLATLPVGAFNGLASLRFLYLDDNDLTTLPVGAFNGLAGLRTLLLNDNESLTVLPVGVFDGLASLRALSLFSNAFTPRTGLPPGIFDDVLDTLGPIGASADFRVDAAVRAAHFVCARSDAAAIVAATAGVDDCLRITAAQLAAAGVLSIATLIASGSPAEPTDGASNNAVTGAFTLQISPAPTSGTAAVTYALSGTAQTADYALAPSAGVTIDSTTQLTIDLAQTPQAVLTLTPAHDTDSGLDETVILTVSGVDFSDATPDITSIAGSPQTLTIRDNVSASICDRTPAVETAILARINAVEEPDVTCDAVTSIHLAAITGTLNLFRQSLAALLTGDFAGLAGPRTLSLYDNELTTLPVGVFNGLAGLQDLYLHDNDLDTLPEEGAFNGLARLRALSLYDNELTTLPEEVFNGLARLRWLSLSDNELSALHEGVFNRLARLRTLFLSDNELSALHEEVFNRLTSLTTLGLYDNELTTLPEGVFNGLARLRWLSLSDNDLDTLPEGVFNGLTSLLTLDLSGNDLDTLPVRVFSGLTSLTTLDLSGGRNLNSAGIPAGLFDDVLDTLVRLTVADGLRGALAFDRSAAGLGQDASVEVDVTLSRALPAAVRVPYALSFGGGADASHFSDDAGGMLTFAAGQTRTSVTVTATENAPVDGTARLTLGAPVLLDGDGEASPLHASALVVEGATQTHTITVIPQSAVVPVVEDSAGICGRTQQVQEQILFSSSSEDCNDVTGSELASVLILFLGHGALSEARLRPGDFQGLSGLLQLALSRNGFTTLPDGIFSELVSLKHLGLSNNGLASLPDGIFSGLGNLRYLGLRNNALTTLPDGIFSDLTFLKYLGLEFNRLTSLSGGAFTGLTSLKELVLNDNGLSSLSADVFTGLVNLQDLLLHDNALTNLPADVFTGLDSLRRLDLSGNPGLTSLEAGVFDDVLDTLRSLYLNDVLKGTVSFSAPAAGLAPGAAAMVSVQLDRALPARVRVPYSVSFAGGAAGDFDGLADGALDFNAGETSRAVRVTASETATPGAVANLALGAPVLLDSDGNANTHFNVNNALAGVHRVLNRHTLIVSGPGSPAPSEIIAFTAVDASSVADGRAIDLLLTLNHPALAGTPVTIIYTIAATGGVAAGDIEDADADGDGDPLTGRIVVNPGSNAGRSTITTTESFSPDGMKTFTVSLGLLPPGISLAAGEDGVATYVVSDICGRTRQVYDAIVQAAAGAAACGDVTPAHLAGITSLDLVFTGLQTLQAGDFAGLINLVELFLNDNSLTGLPDDVFSDLTGLQELNLANNQLTEISADVFNGLTNLRELRLINNSLTDLPVGVFTGLASLEDLRLRRNSTLTSLPVGVFSGLTGLEYLDLSNSGLTSLPADVFSGLTGLEVLLLSGNDPAIFPIDAFADLTSLEEFWWGLNSGFPDGLFDDVLDTLVQLIVANEIRSALSFDQSAAELGQNAPVEVDVTLSRALPAAVRVSYALSFGGGADASHFSDDAGGMLTFSAGQTRTSVTVRAMANAPVDGTARLTLGAPTLLDGTGEASPLHASALVVEGSTQTHTITVVPVTVVDVNPDHGRGTGVVGSVMENEIRNIEVGITVEVRRDGTPLAGTQFALAGSSDFQIDANSGVVTTAGPLNYEALSSPYQITITVMATPPGEASIQRQFIIAVTNVNESPTVEIVAGFGVEIDSGTGAFLATTDEAIQLDSVVMDQDVGDGHRYNWVATPPVGVTLSPSNGITTAFTAIQAGDYLVRLTVTDNGGLSVSAMVTVRVGDPLGICGRTLQVQDRILSSIFAEQGFFNREDCDEVTPAELASVSILFLRNGVLSGEDLQPGDFQGLSGLLQLALSRNGFTTLPDGIFSELVSLKHLGLSNNGLASLPDDIFSGLGNLRYLGLWNNELTTLPDGIFSDLTLLKFLQLQTNLLSSLSGNTFTGLVSLEELSLNDNRLSSLSGDVFTGLVSLQDLLLHDNALTNLPADVFTGLDNLRRLDLSGNPGLTSFEAGVFDDVLDTLRSLYLDDVLKGTVSFSAPAAGLAPGATVMVSVQLDRALPARVRVPYSVSFTGGGAAGDFDGLADGALDFNAGETSRAVRVTASETATPGAVANLALGAPVLLDADGNANTHFNVNNALVEVHRVLNRHTLIVSDASAPSEVIEFTADDAGNAVDGTAIDLLLILNRPALVGTTVTIPYTIAATGGVVAGDIEDADADGDGNPLTGRIVVNPGSNAGRFTIAAAADFRPDGMKTFTVSLGPLPAGLSLAGDEDGVAAYTVSDICGRTQQVRDAIVQATAGAAACGDVTPAHLAGITSLDLGSSSTRLRTLQAGDFAGLTNLVELSLNGNGLTSLPDDVFSDLTGLQELNLEGSQLTELPADIFNGLTNLRELRLINNSLTDLPAGVFTGLTSLEDLRLRRNSTLTSLPAGVFSGLTGLEYLDLTNSGLTSLPDDMFSGLTGLEVLLLSGNDPTIFPVDAFADLTSLQEFWWAQNSGFPAGLFDDVLDTLVQLIVAPEIRSALSFDQSTAELGQNAPVEVGVTLSRTLPAAVRVSYALSFGGGTDASHFSDDAGGMLTFSAGQTRTSVTVRAMANAPVDGTARLTLGAPVLLDGDGEASPLHASALVVEGATQTHTITVIPQEDSAGICGRTQQVQEQILFSSSSEDCNDVTGSELASVSILQLGRGGLSGAGLRSGDFQGLPGLLRLALSNNELTTLPDGIFSELVSLKHLGLSNNGLASLPDGIFSGLGNLRYLGLWNNALTTLPNGIFSDLTLLRYLELESNRLTSLSGGAFTGLTSLKELLLNGNGLSSLSADVFTGLVNLQDLLLHDNALTNLPADVFTGLDSLRRLDLSGNRLTSLEAGVFDDVLDTLRSLYLDDVLKGTVSFSAPAAGLAPGAAAMVSVQLDRALPARVRVPYSVSFAGGAAGDFDGLADGALDFNAGETSRAVRVTASETATPGAVANLALGAPVLLDSDGNANTHFNVNNALAGVHRVLNRHTLIVSGPGSPAPSEIIAFTAVDASSVADGRAIDLLLTLNHPALAGTPVTITYTIAATGGVAAGDIEDADADGDGNSLTGRIIVIPGSNAGRSTITTTESFSPNGMKTFTVSLGSLPAGLSLAVGEDGVATYVVSDICGRTRQVYDAIVQAAAGAAACGDVTPAHLAGITSLDLVFTGLQTLQAGDFAGLINLVELFLNDNSLTGLPDDVFSDLTGLQELNLANNQLTEISADVFNGLTNLRELRLMNNSLTDLPVGVFTGLTSLEELRLQNNSSLTGVPGGVFSGLTGLEYLGLSNSGLTSLPANVFSGLTGLEILIMSGNDPTIFPVDAFAGLTRLEELWWRQSSGFPAGLFDDVLDTLVQLIVAPEIRSALSFDQSAAELGQNAPVEVDVTLSRALPAAVRVSYALSFGGGADASHFSDDAGGVLTFTAGQTRTSVTVRAMANAPVNGMARLTLGAPVLLDGDGEASPLHASALVVEGFTQTHTITVIPLQLRVTFGEPGITLVTAPGTVEVRVQPALMSDETITVDLGVEREAESAGTITVTPSVVVLNADQSATAVTIAMMGVPVGESATVTLTINAGGTDVGSAQASASGDLRVDIMGRDVTVVFLDDASFAQITTLTLSAGESTMVRVSTTPTLSLNESVTLDIEVPGDIGLSAEPAFVSLSSGTTNTQVELRAERLAEGTGDVQAQTRSRSAMGVAVLDGSLGVTVDPMTFTVTLAGVGSDLVSGRSTATRLSVSPALEDGETITVNFVAAGEIMAVDPVTLDAAGRSSATITVTAADNVAADGAFMVTPQIDSDQSNIGNADVTAAGSLQGTVRRLFIVSFSQNTLTLTHRQASLPVDVRVAAPLLASDEEITVTLTSSDPTVTVLPGSVTLTQGAQSTTVTIQVPFNHQSMGEVGTVALSVESTGGVGNRVFTESDGQPLNVSFEDPAVYPTAVSTVRAVAGLVPEGGTVEIVIELDGAVPFSEEATISYQVSGDGGIPLSPNDDLDGFIGTATIAAEQVATTVRVGVGADARVENTESGRLSVQGDVVFTRGTGRDFTAQDMSAVFGLLDRTTMAVTIAAGGAAEGFAGAAGTIPVTVSVANAQALHLDRNVDVMLSFADGSAQSGVDYTPPGPAVVTFTNSLPGLGALPEHDPGTGTVLSMETVVTLIPDALGEGDETFIVSIIESQQDTAVERAATTHTATATIEDSNRLSVSLSGPVGSVAEDAGSVEVAVLVNSASNNPVTLVSSVTVSVATNQNGAAVEGEDYAALNETVTIPPDTYPSIGSAGNRIAVEIGILDDTIVEPDGKSFRVVLTTSDGRVTLGTAEATVTIDDNDVTAVLSPVGADALSVSAGRSTMLTVTTAPVLEPGETAMLTLTPGGVAGVSLNPAQVTLNGATAPTTQVTVIAGLQASQLAEDVAGTVAVSAAVGSGVHVNFGESLPLVVMPLQVEVMFDETGIELIAGEVRTIGFKVSPADRGTPISVVFVENEAGDDITVASPVIVADGTTTGDVSVTVGMGASPGLTANVTVDTQGTDAGRAQVFATNSLRVTVVRAVDAVLEPVGALNLSAGRSMMLTVTTNPVLEDDEAATLTLNVSGAAGVSLSSMQVVLNGGSAETRSTQVELIAAPDAAGMSGEVSVAVEANSGVKVNAPSDTLSFSVTQLQLRVAFDEDSINLAIVPGTVEVRVQPALLRGETITVDLGVEREAGSAGTITVSPSAVVLNAGQSATAVTIIMTGVPAGESATVTLTINAGGTDVGSAQASAEGDLRVDIVGRDVTVVFLDDASLAQITTLTLSANELTTVRVSTVPALDPGESVMLDLGVFRPRNSNQIAPIHLSVNPGQVMLSGNGPTSRRVTLTAPRLAGGVRIVGAQSRSAVGVAVADGSLAVTVEPMTFTVSFDEPGTDIDLVSGRSTMARVIVSPELIGEENILVSFVKTGDIGIITSVSLSAAGGSSETVTVTALGNIAVDSGFTVSLSTAERGRGVGNANVTVAEGSRLQGTVRRLFIVSFSQETLMLTHRRASSPITVGTGESPLLTSGEEITVTLTSSGSVTVGGPVTLTQGAQSTTVTIQVPPDHEGEGNVGSLTLSAASTGGNNPVFVESDDQPLRVFFEPNRGIMLRIRVFLEGALQ